MTKVKDIVERLRKDFPEDIASQGDPVGMQIGSMESDVTNVMTTLDVQTSSGWRGGGKGR